jgi:hypothetical protein
MYFTLNPNIFEVCKILFSNKRKYTYINKEKSIQQFF